MDDGRQNRDLLPLALPALKAVFDPAGHWYGLWFDPEGLAEWHAVLATLLSAPTIDR